jgi:hypothetical protein
MAVSSEQQRAGLMSDLTRRYMRDVPAMLSFALRGERTFEGALIPKGVIDTLAPAARQVVEDLAKVECDKIMGSQEANRQKAAAKKADVVPAPAVADVPATRGIPYPPKPQRMDKVTSGNKQEH